MPEVTHEGHAEKLEYGWWEPKRGNVLLPKTLGDKRNFVLTHEELAAYDCVLVEMKRSIEREQERVATTLVALRKGRIHRWDMDPTCFTLAHLLEFLVMGAKHKLASLTLVNNIMQRRKES